MTPWNGGNVAWERSHLNRDHLWGHGNVDADLAPSQQGCLLWRRGRTLLRLTDGRRAVAYHASGALEFHGGIEPMADLFEEMPDARHLTSLVKKAAGRLDAPYWVGRDERLVFERLWRIKAAAADARANQVSPVLCRAIGAFRHMIGEVPVLGAASMAVQITGSGAYDVVRMHHLGDRAVVAKMVPHAHDKVLADSACQTLLGFEAERC
ncbi:MAG: hypothetical protein HYZ59_02025, partial [Actinobacteria bacterium]|nr:hypothetical protein [Actinomycetota bacterium]